MAGGILLSLIVAAIIICVIFLLLLYIKQPQANKLKVEKVTLEGLSYATFIKPVIDVVMPKENEKEYRTCERLIADSGFNISMRGVYLLKVLVPIVLLVIMLSIYFINKNLVIEEIMSGRLEKTVETIGSVSTSDSASNEDKKKNEKASKDTYIIIENLINTRILKNQDSVDAKLAIQNAVIDNKVIVEGSIESAVNDFYNKMMQIESAKSVSPITIMFILIVSLAGFMLPNGVLSLSRFLRYQAFDNEVIALEMLTILVGSIENITVKEMLRILEKNSKVFKKSFEKALLEYPIDFEQALINLENSSKNKDFQALISTLRQCATSDKYSALQTLQRRRISRKEYRKLMEEKKIETKTMVGLVCLVPVLFFLAKLLLAPWMQKIYGTGIM